MPHRAPLRSPGQSGPHPHRVRWMLGAILLIATGFRLWHIDFGLPALHDPDEPIFGVLSLKLLQSGNFNPGWFGHPGTTTLYLLALVDICVILGGQALGVFDGPKGFLVALYTDPSIVILPARILIAMFGVASVGLTYRIGERLLSRPAGLVAALLLALCPLHVEYSQIIRTDIMASTFMLSAILVSVSIAEGAALRSILLACLFVGLATATKWPGASVLIVLIAAIVWHARNTGSWTHVPARVALVIFGSIAALILVSPYILLDYQQVYHDLLKEAPASHLGATGLGLGGNLLRYVGGYIPDAMSWPVAALSALGVLIMATRHARAFVLIAPITAVFLVGISAQSLIWPRWVVPLMPLLCLFAGVAITEPLRLSLSPSARYALMALLLVGALVPITLASIDGRRERGEDTRSLATRWALAQVPPGSRVAMEYFGFDMIGRGWRLHFPMGAAGCMTTDDLLGNRKIGFSDANSLRGPIANVNLGTVAPDRLSTCTMDYAFITDYDRYLKEPGEHAQEIRTYRTLLRGSETVAIFRPQPGQTGGPLVRVVRWRHAGPYPPIDAVSGHRSINVNPAGVAQR